ncbi:carbon-nitrogen hydrolase family protein [Microbacterium stercoris]|uniref:Carbon-nitrogen hydrolase family protein n=1 Tax=Microbacterium stercoris TaxID=2820289 RepID=A0A939QRV3_9MICO|nr:carbon-nitrogen hydrolase family protein [Microbacterium stercoris]MBO3663953.1 carbon-nitrogen hydrolase family protein [Microbacterium stercoris]
MTLRIAAVQAESVPGNFSANITSAARWVRAASVQGARLVVFPEAFVTGYDEGVFAAGSTEFDFAPLQSAIDETGAVAVVNTPLDGRLASLVFAPGAAPVPAYAKQHLHASERTHFSPGEGGATIDIDGVPVALSVCYDANFPEHAAAAAADGALVYVNSGAYFPGGEARRDLHYAARALDNGLYVVFAGLVGAPHDFIGGSAVFDPVGRRIATADAREGLAIADVDPAVIAETRDAQRMWADRRATLGERTRTLIA